jgi:predicted alpha/beta-hydrolase family hydrolase
MTPGAGATRGEPVAIPTPAGAVSGLLDRPDGARFLLVLGHGAGAGMRHRFFESLVPLLGQHGVAVLRYQFPYMEAGGRRPDPPTVAQATVRAVVTAAAERAAGLPLLAGGKSFGGRMTSQAQSTGPLPGVRGLVFLGFPLHAAGRPSSDRADHLDRVTVPMLFLQGTRDTLADLTQLRPVVDRIGTRATLHVVDGADHSFGVLKRSGRAGEDVLRELAETVATWGAELVG